MLIHPYEKGLRREEESDFVIESKPNTRDVVISHDVTHLKSCISNHKLIMVEIINLSSPW